MKDIVFFGAGDIVLDMALWCKEQQLNCLITTNPAQGAGITLGSESLSDYCTRQGIGLTIAEEPESLAVENFDKSTIFISVGAPWIFRPAFLCKLAAPVLNLHGTHLPKNRGGNLFSWQILMGQRTGTCLLHELTGGIDEGPIAAWEEFIYPAHCRKPTDFMNVYRQKNVAFLKKYLSEEPKTTSVSKRYEQPEYLSTYWPRLKSSVNGWIDWSWNATDIERFICAFDEPYPGARTRFRGRTVLLRDVWHQSMDGTTHPFQSGLVYRNNGQWLQVAAKGGELLVCSVLDEQGVDLLSSIKPGDRFYSLPEDLSGSKRRVIKSRQGLNIQQELD